MKLQHATVRDSRAATPRWFLVLLIWAIISGELLFQGRSFIAAMNFRDADDALRLVQVRDWMAGQSWFDVVQHRINPPHSMPMHWSRLVDVPIAAVIHLASLFFAPGIAERIAMVAVPLLMFLALHFAVARLAGRVTRDSFIALVAVVMLGMSVGVDIQFQPMRIDHHGWQILLNTLACLMLLETRDGPRWKVVASGVFMALSLTVALESLPMAVAIAGVIALRFLFDPKESGSLSIYLVTLVSASTALVVSTLGFSGAAVSWCDTLSPAYLGPLLAVAITFPVAARLVGITTPAQRIACLAVTGLVGAAIFLGGSPQCARGPFSTLDPIVYQLWYTSVGEGMPPWTQSRDIAAVVPVQSLIGLIGTFLAIRFEPAERRRLWIDLLILQSLAFAVSMMVVRAMGLAHVLALPGAAWLFVMAVRQLTRHSSPVVQVALGLLCLLLTPLGAQSVVLAAIGDPDAGSKVAGNVAGHDADQKPWVARYTCTTFHALRGLDSLPTALLFAPLDISAHLLAYTHHSVVATGHHRNMEGMRTAILGFVSDPDKARPIVTGTSARYLAYCSGENEVKKYILRNRHSLMAALEHGAPPNWLEPVPMRKGELIHVYRIVRSDQLGTNRIATPFMQ
jgi:hypothetical protein